MKCKLIYWIVLILFISFSAFKKVVANASVRYFIVSLPVPFYLFDHSQTTKSEQNILLQNNEAYLLINKIKPFINSGITKIVMVLNPKDNYRLIMIPFHLRLLINKY